jgi:hypothetical protein
LFGWYSDKHNNKKGCDRKMKKIGRLISLGLVCAIGSLVFISAGVNIEAKKAHTHLLPGSYMFWGRVKLPDGTYIYTFIEIWVDADGTYEIPDGVEIMGNDGKFHPPVLPSMGPAIPSLSPGIGGTGSS